MIRFFPMRKKALFIALIVLLEIAVLSMAFFMVPFLDWRSYAPLDYGELTVTKSATQGPRAFTITLFTKDYVNSAMQLCFSLKDLGHPVVAIYIPKRGIEPRVLNCCFDELIETKPILTVRPHVVASWKELATKLIVFNLTKYEKVLSLDADITVYEPERYKELLESDLELAMVPDWEGRGLSRTIFNGGLVLLSPSAKTFEALMDGIDEYLLIPSHGFVDQDYLSHFFSGKISPLSMKWALPMNVRTASNRAWAKFSKGVYAVHFTAMKPWETYESAWPLSSWIWRDEMARKKCGHEKMPIDRKWSHSFSWFVHTLSRNVS